MLHRIRRILLKAGWARTVARELTSSSGRAIAVHSAFIRLLAREVYPGSSSRQVVLSLTWNHVAFTYAVRGLHDMGTLVEVFVDGEYADATVPTDAHILDLGANTGASSVYFAIRFPGSVIHAYEPDVANHATLARNTAAFPGITIWREAASASDGVVIFHEDPETGNSSSLIRRRDRQRAIEVPSVSLATALGRLPDGRANLVKYDIEGGEYALFRSETAFNGIRSMIGEHHQDLGTDPDLMKLLRTCFSCDVRPLGPDRTLVYSVRPESQRD